MPLSAGARLGPYEILSAIGADGMGEVYQARDTRLDRSVAIKTLPPDVSADPDRRARFEREAKTIAGLNHPHICTLHDVGEHDGSMFLVMEHLVGETLAACLAKGPLPLEQALTVATEIADALAAAHRQGVIHRDLKPGNVMLTKGGTKLLDFGLAKLMGHGEQPAATHLASAPTQSVPLSGEGVILGTLQYMAPEQLEGKPADARTDLWALGAILYEMVTGRRAFEGASAASLIGNIMNAEPASLSTLQPLTPPALDRVVRRCLKKDPDERWDTAHDVADELRWVRETSGSGADAAAMQTAHASATKGLPTWLWWVAAATAIVAVAFAAAPLLRRGPLVVSTADIIQITSEPGVEFQPAISPDGSQVAFVAGPIGAPHLAVRSALTPAAGGQLLLGDAAAGGVERYPSWTPDGERVRFLGCGKRMTRPPFYPCGWQDITRLGGAARPTIVPELLSDSEIGGISAPAWSPDGTRVAFVREEAVYVNEAAGGTAPRRIAAHPKNSYEELHSLAWSPDGRRIAYVNGNFAWLAGGRVRPSSIWVVDTSGGDPWQVAGGGFLNVSPTWFDAGHLLFVANRDGPRGAYIVELGARGPAGQPALIPGIADPHSISYSMASGRLAFSKFVGRQNIRAYPLNASSLVPVESGQPVTTGIQVVERHDVAPDGAWLAFDSNRRGNIDLFKVPAAGGGAVLLTESTADEYAPRWSPDGREMAYYTGGDDGGIYVMPVGGGPAANLTKGPGRDRLPVWSPSGLHIAFDRTTDGKQALWLLSRDTLAGAWHAPVRLTDFRCAPNDWIGSDEDGVLCDDGGHMVWVSPDGRVLARRAPAPPGWGLVYWDFPRYSRDGRTIYYWAINEDGRQGVWAVARQGSGGPRLVVLSGPVQTFPAPYLSVGPNRLYLTVSEHESDIWVARLRY